MTASVALRIVDLGVTTGVLLALLYLALHFRSSNVLVRLGIQTTIPAMAALVFNISDRILEAFDDSVRSGYVFAVISRIGLLLLFSGLALALRKGPRKNDREVRQEERCRVHRESPACIGHSYVIASGVPRKHG